jgi:hypothetical protein
MRQAGWLAVSCWLMGCVLAGAQPGGPPTKDPSYEEIIQQMLAALEQMTKVLVAVKDEPSAEAARPNLKQAAGKFLVVRKQSEQLKTPDLKQKDQIEKKYHKPLAEAVQKFRSEIRRVQDIPGGLALLKELDEVFKKPKKKEAP